MPVTISPIGALKTYIKDRAEIQVEAAQPVRAALQKAGIPIELVALVVVNGEAQGKDYLLRDGDVVKVMAVIGGG
jgi:sulfur carrier protein ThiS